MILLHVLIAFVSLALTSYVYIKPSVGGLRTAYGLVGATIATGLYLVANAPAHMLEGCLMGVLYLAVVSLGIVAARTKLATQKVNNHS